MTPRHPPEARLTRRETSGCNRRYEHSFAGLPTQGNPFSSLFDYLKRIDGKLVVLEAVRTEFLAVYRRELEARGKKSESAWKSLQSLLSNRENQFDSPDIEREAHKVEDRLMNNPSGVKVVLYSAAVDVAEVVRRGAERIPPANEKGEELRDVIIWLSVLHYAKQTKGNVAFVSSDRGFWDAGPILRKAINEEVSSVGGRLRLYFGLDEFFSQNNLRSTDIDAAWLSSYIKLDDLKDAVAGQVRVALSVSYYQRVSEVALEAFDFASGASYELSSASMFVEFRCKFKASTKTSEPSVNIGFFPASFANLASSASPAISADANTFIGWGDLETPLKIESFFSPIKIESFSPTSLTTLSAVAPVNVFSTIPIQPPAKLNGEALFSMRITNGAVQNINLDNVTF